MTSDNLDAPRADTEVATTEQRSGVRLSRIRGGERTWNLWIHAGDDPAELRAAIAALRELDAELEHGYGREPRVHPPPGHDAGDECAP